MHVRLSLHQLRGNIFPKKITNNKCQSAISNWLLKVCADIRTYLLSVWMLNDYLLNSFSLACRYLPWICLFNLQKWFTLISNPLSFKYDNHSFSDKRISIHWIMNGLILSFYVDSNHLIVSFLTFIMRFFFNNFLLSITLLMLDGESLLW